MKCLLQEARCTKSAQPRALRYQGAKSTRGSGPKFGYRELWQKTERDTELTQYIERRPKKIYKKTIEQKINKHRRDSIRKNIGDKRSREIENRLMTLVLYLQEDLVSLQLVTWHAL